MASPSAPANLSVAPQSVPASQSPQAPPNSPDPPANQPATTTASAKPFTAPESAPAPQSSQAPQSPPESQAPQISPNSPVNQPGTTTPTAPILVNGATTQPISPLANQPATIQIGSQSFTANTASDFVIGSQTLAPGGPAITVSNTPISLAPSASFLVVGSTTQKLGPSPAPAPTLAPQVITVAGQTYTGNAASGFVLNGQTLKPGSVITVGGMPASMAPSGSFIVAGTSTMPLAMAPTTQRLKS